MPCELRKVDCTCPHPGPDCLWWYDSSKGTPIAVDKTLNRAQRAILGALKLDVNATAPIVCRRLRMFTGTAYPALHALELKGYVKSVWLTPGGLRPRRRVYNLTDVGRSMVLNTQIERHDRQRARQHRNHSSWWLVAAALIMVAIAVWGANL